MKTRILLAILFLLPTTFLTAQEDWALFPQDQRTYFDYGGDLRLYYNDSTEVYADYNLHLFGKKYYEGIFDSCHQAMIDHPEFPWGYAGNYQVDTMYSNATEYFWIIETDTLYFYPETNVGEGWPVLAAGYSDIDSFYIRCIQEAEIELLGVTDIVKTFEVDAFFNGASVNHPFEELNLELSKTIGFISFFNLQQLLGPPTGTVELYTLYGLKTVTGEVYGNVPTPDLFLSAYQPGTILKWHGWYDYGGDWWEARDSIFLVETTSPDSRLYHAHRTKIRVNIWYDYSLEEVVIDTIYSTEEDYISGAGVNSAWLNGTPGWFSIAYDPEVSDYTFCDFSIVENGNLQFDLNSAWGELVMEDCSTSFWWDSGNESTSSVYNSKLGLISWRGPYGDYGYDLIGAIINGDTTGNVSSVFTSAKEIKTSSISFTLFPNPASTELHLQWPKPIFANDPLQIQIFDSLGRLVKESRLSANEESINIEHLLEGIYYLKVGNSAGWGSEVLVIQ